MTEIIVTVVLAVIAGLFGIRRGRKQSEDKRAKADAKAYTETTRKAEAARDEVSGMSDADVLERLRNRSGKR